MTIEPKLHISLIPINASLRFTELLSDSHERVLNMGAQLKPDIDVHLAADGGFKDNWMVEIIETDVREHATAQGAIGFVRRGTFDGGNTAEFFYVSVALKRESFSTLLSALQQGRLPEKIQIEAKGPGLSWMALGTGIVWDAGSDESLFVEDVTFNVPLVANFQQERPDSAEVFSPSSRLPVTVHDLKLLERRLVVSLISWGVAAVRLGLALVVVTLVGVVLLYLRH